MKVLSIDPGYGRCGVAVIEKQKNQKEALLYSECIETKSETDFPTRLLEITSQVRELIKEHSPEALAIEKLFFNKNTTTAMKVAQVKGALIHVSKDAGLDVFEYTPLEIKNAVTGYGKSTKRQVIEMTHALINIEKDIKHDDEYDAIAVGLTCTASSY